MTTVYKCRNAACKFCDQERGKCALDEIVLDDLGLCEEFESRE